MARGGWRRLRASLSSSRSRDEQVDAAAGGEFHEFLVVAVAAAWQRCRDGARRCLGYEAAVAVEQHALRRFVAAELRIGEYALQLGEAAGIGEAMHVSGINGAHQRVLRGSRQCSSSMTTLVSSASFIRRAQP